MTIIQRHADELHLCLIEFSGPIRLADMHAHIDFRSGRRDLLTADILHILRDDAVFVDLDFEKLDAFRERLRSLLTAARLPVVRRTAWMCRREQTTPLLKHFLADRSHDDGLFAMPRLVETLEEAAEWLGTPADKLAAALSAPIIGQWPPAPARAL